MSEKFKAVRGSEERADEVKQWLLKQGAKNIELYPCDREDLLYYVMPTGSARSIRLEHDYLFDVEKLPRWRAERGQMYYYISGLCEVITGFDDYLGYDNNHYELGNYFKKKEEAEKFCLKMIKLFEDRKNE